MTRKNEWILAINDPSLLVIARRFNQLIQKINGVPGEISQTTAKAAISLQLDRQATDNKIEKNETITITGKSEQAVLQTATYAPLL